MTKVKCLWEKHKNTLLFCLAVTFIFGIAAHGFHFLNFRFSHDSLDGLYFPGRENYHKAELGRFFSPVYRFIFRGKFSAPWITAVLALLWIGIAVFFIAEILDIKSKTAVLLISGIMTTNITVTALTATFIHDLDANMFCLMLSCLAVLLWAKDVKFHIVGGAVLLCIALGIYPSYISVSVILIMAVLIKRLFENRTLGKTVSTAASAFLMGVGGLLCYLLCAKAASAIFAVTFAQRENSIAAISDIGLLASLPKNIIYAYVRWWEYFSDPHTNWLTPKLMFALNITIMITAVAAVVVLIIKKNIPFVNSALIMGAVVLMPLIMNLIYLVSPNEYHDLMTYSFVFVYILAVYIAYCTGKNNHKTMAYVLAAMIVYGNIQTANDIYMKKNMSYQATYARMSIVLEDMLEYGYTPNSEEIFISGEINVPAYTEFDNLNGIRGILYDNAVTSDVKSIDYYFDFVLGCPVTICSDTTRKRIKDSEEYRNMPVFPQNGYIDRVNDILVVKLR